MIVYNPGLITPKVLSTAISFPGFIAHPISVLSFSLGISETSTVSDSEMTIYKQAVLHEELSPILASTTCELTAPSDAFKTVPTSVILYEPTDSLSSTMCEPISPSDLPIPASTMCELIAPSDVLISVPTSIILYEPTDTLSSTMCEPRAPSDGELSISILASTTYYELTTQFITVSTKASMFYKQTEYIPTLSSSMCKLIAPYDIDVSIPTRLALTATIAPTFPVTVYKPMVLHKDISIPTVGSLTNNPTFVSASVLTINKRISLSAVSTPTVLLDLDLTPVSIREESIYEVITYTPYFVPGGSCPNDNMPAPAMPEVGWFHYVSGSNE